MAKKAARMHCCDHCSCLAVDTLIQVNQRQAKAIQDFDEGDNVLAAGLDLKWSSKPVFYSRASNDKNIPAVFVEYSLNSQNLQLIVSPNHLFLMPDKSLKAANQLNNKDKLVSHSGKQIDILSVNSAPFSGGMHNIATAPPGEPDDNPEGHLLVANGIVCADYALQLHFQPDQS